MARLRAKNLFKEARRRRVFRTVGLYIVGAWLMVQIALAVFPALSISEAAIRYIWTAALLGFPLAVVFGWRYDIRGGRVERTASTGTDVPLSLGRGDFFLLGALGVVATAILASSLWEISTTNPEQGGSYVPTDVDINSVAVLPFLNMSSDPEQEYFSDGITEEVLNLLVKIPELKVTSRTSVFSFKGQSIDIPTVAEKLGVAHILEGSVRRAGDRIRITAQLIEARNDVHLWSETYERQLDDIFAIQDEIAKEVVKALQIQLLGEAPLATSTNKEAYNLYLRGKHFATLGTLDGLDSSVKAYRDSIALDANFAPPWVGLSSVLRRQGWNGVTDLHEAIEASRYAAMRALELDSELAEAWLSLAEIQFDYDWDWTRGEATIRKALEYGPNNAPVLRQATWMALALGEPERAMELAQHAVDLDPLDFAGLTNLASAHWALGQLEEEEQTYWRILDLYPDAHAMYSFLAAALAQQGKPEEGLQYLDFDSPSRWHRSMSAIVLHSLGRHEEERSIRQTMVDEYSQTWPAGIAMTYAWHGERDKAFEWLDIAFERRSFYMTNLLVNPWLVPLHDDPRWEQLLDNIGLLKYWKKSQARQPSKS
jgi:TolB-like protein